MDTSLLPPWSLLSAFLIASFVLAVTPGPGVLYIVTRSVVQGRRSGLVSVAAIALGNLVCAIGASLGLAALFAASAHAFSLVKYAGALYLVWLGVQMLRGHKPQAGSAAPAETAAGRTFRDGLLIAILNPKTIIFFAAFLPQFLSPHGSQPALQACMLGAIFVAIAAVTDACYAIAAGRIARAVGNASNARRAGRWAGGMIFIGLGVYTALSGTQSRRG